MNPEYEDLIERYLTGQASPAEAAELLQAMRADPSLASAMDATSVIHEATAEDASSYVLPASNYDRVLVEAEALRVLPTQPTPVAPTAITSISLLVIGSALAVAVTMVNNHSPVDVIPTAPLAEPVHLQLYVPHDTPTPIAVRETIMETTPEPHEQIESGEPLILVASTQETQLNLEHASFQPMMRSEIPSRQQSSRVHDLALRVASRPVTTFSYAASTSGTTSNNLLVELGYNLSEHHQVGVSIHQDQFPVNEHVSTDQVVERTMVTWFGLQYRYQPEVSLPLNARPFAQLGVGGSQLGVLTQPTIGVMIPLYGFQIGIGADALLMAYQYQGNWSIAASPGLRCELGYQFSFSNL